MPSPIYPRSLDDLIISGLKAKIERHRDDDILVHPGLNYLVERDRTRPWQELGTPLVNLESPTDEPKGRDYTARIVIQCLVPVLDDDETAVARLYTLKEQVRRAITDRDDPDLGQALGLIGSVGAPSWQRMAFDDSELEETTLAGTWTTEVSYHYEPAEITGPALDELSITLGRFEALYQFGGNT